MTEEVILRVPATLVNCHLSFFQRGSGFMSTLRHSRQREPYPQEHGQKREDYRLQSRRAFGLGNGSNREG